jgi:hypothetical protein
MATEKKGTEKGDITNIATPRIDNEKGDITNIATPRIALCDGMPRTASASVGGMWYHVLNRGKAVFHKPGDYDAFAEASLPPALGFPWMRWDTA